MHTPSQNSYQGSFSPYLSTMNKALIMTDPPLQTQSERSNPFGEESVTLLEASQRRDNTPLYEGYGKSRVHDIIVELGMGEEQAQNDDGEIEVEDRNCQDFDDKETVMASSSRSFRHESFLYVNTRVYHKKKKDTHEWLAIHIPSHKTISVSTKDFSLKEILDLVINYANRCPNYENKNHSLLLNKTDVSKKQENIYCELCMSLVKKWGFSCQACNHTHCTACFIDLSKRN